MSRTTTSFRLDDGLRERLAARASREGITLTSLIERIMREGLAMEEHPGIVFKSGPSGRRAALAGGPDVWEIVSAARDASGKESERIASLASEFGLHQRQILIALNYAAMNPDEIETRIQANDRAHEEAEHIAEGRKRLLA